MEEIKHAPREKFEFEYRDLSIITALVGLWDYEDLEPSNGIFFKKWGDRQIQEASDWELDAGYHVKGHGDLSVAVSPRRKK